MRVRLIIMLLAVFMVLGLSYNHLVAQNLVTCPTLVQKAIDSVGNNCGSLERNSACYGFNSIVASFSQPQPVNFFTRPSDRAQLSNLKALNAGAMNETMDEWGIALLSVQANLPETLPGQSVIFMLMGDTQIENAIAPSAAFRTGNIVNVTFRIDANLYYEPSLSANVVGSVPAGTALSADAISADSGWVRVVYAGMPGWVTRQVIDAGADVSTLAVIGANTYTPMQAFYFRTGISGTDCVEAPNSLVVQGPRGLAVDINANGADIRLGSTIALFVLPIDPVVQAYITSLYGDVGPIGGIMQIIVLDGHVVLDPDTDHEQVLTTGQTSFRCLSLPETLGVDGLSNDRTVIAGCPWVPSRDVTDLDLLQFRALDGFVLNYPIDLPLDLPTLTPIATSAPPEAPSAIPAGTATPTDTPAPTLTPSDTYTPTLTFTPSDTYTPTLTFTPSDTYTPTLTFTPITYTPTASDTPTNTPTPSDTPTATPTDTPTLTPTDTPSSTPTDTPTNTPTPTATPTFTLTPTDTPTTVSCPTGPFNVASGDSAGLIAAIGDANCDPGTDTINLATGNFFYGGAFVDVDGPNALPAITSHIIINGNGSGIYGNNETTLRFFHVNGGAMLELNNAWLHNGAMDGGYNGGALYNLGTTILSGVTITSNRADYGGGIYNAGSLTLYGGSLGYNSAFYQGGGIYNVGSASLTGVTIAYGNASSGGGIYNAGSGALTTLNSTISNNSTSSGASGVYTEGTANLSFTTIFGNLYGVGFLVGGGSANVRNSLFGDNGTNCSGGLAASGANFADDTSCPGFGMIGQGTVAPLSAYGGSNDTNLPLSGNPAIDSADCTAIGGGTVSTDQRGYGRPADGDNSPSANECDAGAVEYQPGVDDVIY